MTKHTKQLKAKSHELPPKKKEIHPFLLILEEQKEIMKAVRAGKPASSVPPIWKKLRDD